MSYSIYSKTSTDLGVTPDTVRYQVRIGVAKPEYNSDNGYRMLGHHDLTKVTLFLKARGGLYGAKEVLAL